MGKIDVDRLLIYLWGNTIHFDCIECALKEQGLKIVNGEIVEIDAEEKSGSREYHRVPSVKPKCVLKEMLDELKENESEDEKIKEAIRYAIGQSTHSDGTLVEGVLSETAITWIQKHGERSLRLKEMLAADKLASAEMTGMLKERKELLGKIGNSQIQKQGWSVEDEKNQAHWRPSDLQIEALESATANCAYSEYQDCLRELAKQLKKMKGEY